MGRPPEPAIRSDFRDYYDPAAPPRPTDPALVLERFADGGPSRRFQHRLLVDYGFAVPDFGDAASVTRRGAGTLVLYDDERAHRGEGKRLVTAATLTGPDLGRYAARYFPPASGQATSTRLLAVGSWLCVLRYESDDGWRSNVGDVTVTFREAGPLTSETLQRYAPDARPLGAPLWAVDLVDAEPGPLAVDLNLAPRLAGTGVEQLATATEVVAELGRWMTEERRDPQLRARRPEPTRG